MIPKLSSLASLIQKLRPLHGRKKIVFTNGCFDLLHRGHVEYLARARALGDLLIVGLNSDAGVRRLKGISRPICPLRDRAAVLAALECVDWIVPFSEQTPEQIIRAIRPQVLVKGADYRESEIAGAAFVRSMGGRVARVTLTRGKSTSQLIHRIRSIDPPQAAPDHDPSILVVIPARYGSTRFPGKTLANLAGKTVLEHVYEKARRAAGPGWQIVIATDDRRILKTARGFGADASLTSPACISGSDRCAEIARSRPAARIVVNLQGDEPFQHPANIRLAVQTLRRSHCPVATLVTPCPEADYDNPNVAKVAVSRGRAIFFSRSRIPFYRDESSPGRRPLFKHIGLYVFRRDFLLTFAGWAETPLEQAEKLEQLRILEHGFPIAVAVTNLDSIGIDTPADLARARSIARA